MSRSRFLDRWARLKAAEAAKPPAALPPATAPAAKSTESLLREIEQLTPESDFTAFLQKEVSEALRRQALKKLFSDPRLNVIDPLDIYIDDYTIADPIPPEMLAGLKQMQSLFPRPAEEAPVEELAPTLEQAAGEPPIAATQDSVEMTQSDHMVASKPGKPSPERDI